MIPDACSFKGHFKVVSFRFKFGFGFRRRKSVRKDGPAHLRCAYPKGFVQARAQQLGQNYVLGAPGSSRSPCKTWLKYSLFSILSIPMIEPIAYSGWRRTRSLNWHGKPIRATLPVVLLQPLQLWNYLSLHILHIQICGRPAGLLVLCPTHIYIPIRPYLRKSPLQSPFLQQSSAL